MSVDPSAFERWDPKTQEYAAEALKKAISGERRVWFCANPGRTCDGKPHEGYDYPHARSDQWPPPGNEWLVWLLSGGRGSGKTRTGAEYTRKMSEHVPQMRVVAPTGPDMRQVCIEGESGLIYACERAGIEFEWEPSKREFTFANGCKLYGFSAEEPDRLRGKQSGFDWLDEPAHMPDIDTVWYNLKFGLRLGKRGRILCTTTPLPTKWIKKLVAHPKTITVTVPTHVNLDNLAENYRELIADYEGTRLGRQELLGEILSDTEGTLWLEQFLIRKEWVAFDFDRVVIGIDPAGTASKRSDETGMIVAARMGDLYYVLADTSGRMRPEQWAAMADSLYERFLADALVPEKNFGGDMVVSTLRNTGREAMHIKPVTARRGKALRAEPVVALYEQGKVIHMPAPGQDLTDLETEMLEWVPGKGDSPNRVDALVHALTELAGPGGGQGFISLPGATPLRGPVYRPGMYSTAQRLYGATR